MKARLCGTYMKILYKQCLVTDRRSEGAKMKITLAEMTIIIDTLSGSLHILDDGTHWKYTTKARKDLAESLLRRMEQIDLSVAQHEQSE